MRKVFDTPGRVELEVRVAAGRLELEAADAATTEVEVTPLDADDASRLAADETRIELRPEPSRTLVYVEVPRRGQRFFASEPQFLVTVRAPNNTDIDANVSSADVTGRGSFGGIQIKTASGDLAFDSVQGADVKSASGNVRVARVNGEAKFQTASGDIAVEHLDGPGKVQTASGDVVIASAGSNLKVQTASGDQRIDAVVSGQVSLQSASGDLKVGVARGSTLWVDARSLSGETTSELDVGDEPPDIEGPHVDLRATAMSGDIHIARADALS